MKLTINVPDRLLRIILRESVGLTAEGVRKVVDDPRFQRALQREAQTHYIEAVTEGDPANWLGDIVYGTLRIAKKYQTN